tara:strand:+ start:265 stop:510 length:246 start_codon:yes stop_codon:yes gene_type:complete
MSSSYGNNRQIMIMEAELRQLVRDTRIGLGMSGADVADRIEVSRPFYTQLEGGTRRMSLYYFLGICKALRMSPVEMFAGVK